MVGQHHQLNEREFEQTLGDNEGEESWHAAVHGIGKESDMTQQLNSNSRNHLKKYQSSQKGKTTGTTGEHEGTP